MAAYPDTDDVEGSPEGLENSGDVLDEDESAKIEQEDSNRGRNAPEEEPWLLDNFPEGSNDVLKRAVHLKQGG